ncbi:MAG: tetratricopeptide repeat protein, partial [Burkholderiales bacterium]
MKFKIFVLTAGLAAALSVVAAEQEETYTDLTPGTGVLDPARLAELVRQGDVRAMNNVGLLWAKGFEGKQSYEEALRWWREAAKRGYTVAMNNIGLAYASGHGVETDMSQAFEW